MVSVAEVDAARGFIPDIAFGREPSHSTGGTFTHVDASFPSAHLNSEVRKGSVLCKTLWLR